MSIKIELVFDTIEEAAIGLAKLAQTFLSATSFHTVDTAQHKAHSEGASPVEEDSPAPAAKRGRGRPPKVKAEEQVSPPPASEAADTAGEATPSEAKAEEPEDFKQQVQDVITALTEKFQTGDADRKAAIRTWRDGLGLTRMGDLKAEHLPAARELLATMEG